MDTNTAELAQLQLWPEEDLPESQQLLLGEEQDTKGEIILEGGQPLAVQLYLPGFEPK